MASFFLTFLMWDKSPIASNNWWTCLTRLRPAQDTSHTVLGQSDQPWIRRGKLLRNFKTHNPWEETGFFFFCWVPPTCFAEGLFAACLLHMCLLTPNKHLPSTADSVGSAWHFSAAARWDSDFPVFYLVLSMAEKMNPINTPGLHHGCLYIFCYGL